MIVVDTSVWIAHFRNEASQAVTKLRGIANFNDIVVGDLVLLECLQGARDERHAATIESTLRAFTSRRCRTSRSLLMPPDTIEHCGRWG